MYKGLPEYTYQDVQILAKRWDGLVAELEYPSRRLAIRVLYHTVSIWMDGRASWNPDAPLVLGRIASEVSNWVMDHPRAREHCPNLVAMQLNSPRLIEEALQEEEREIGE